MIRWYLKKNPNNTYSIIVECPECGKEGRLQKKSRMASTAYKIVHTREGRGHTFSYTSPEWDELNRIYHQAHEMISSQAEDDAGEYRCFLCGEVVDNYKKLVSHVRSKHSWSNGCPICGAKVRHANHFWRSSDPLHLMYAILVTPYRSRTASRRREIMDKYGSLILDKVDEEVVREVVRKNMRTPTRVLASILGVGVDTIKKIKEEVYVERFGRVVKVKANTKSGKKWSKEEVDKLVELSKMGYTDREIAHILGRTEKAIRSKRRKLKEKNKKKIRWTYEEVDELSKLVRVGYTDEEIAKSLNRTVRAVKSKRLEMGLVKKGRRCNIPSVSFSDNYIYFNGYVSRWASERGYEYVKIEIEEKERSVTFRFMREDEAQSEDDDVYKVSICRGNFGGIVNAKRAARRLKQLGVKVGKIEMHDNIVRILPK